MGQGDEDIDEVRRQVHELLRRRQTYAKRLRSFLCLRAN